MYLKSLEMTGFKSFADRTPLRFEPGMTAIVGPNGCGKSNISDAIRWVLGEQRPTALRGGKMQDVIFNGTDTRKPLGLAEVSITFADCEQLLETDFNEVTITRRAYRSGEGQYLLNRSVCRLRDIQRLFMGTGIGTSSYSVMAQGQIDAILSSRPEDRRVIFEEASGITKFKADRKEALRKLEQTEGNLARLSDVIREVKRQIGSLQRQAGKARRYQALRADLRRLDVFATRKRLGDLDRHIRETEARQAECAERIDAAQARIAETEAGHARLQEGVMRLERVIGGLNEAVSEARNRLASTRERIRINAQREGEYQALIERDKQEIETGSDQLESLRQRLVQQEQALETSETDRRNAEKDLAESQAAYDSESKALALARAELQKLRDTAVERERLVARLQNRLSEIEARQRGVILQRERLRVEQAQLTRACDAAHEQQQTLKTQIDTCEQTVREASDRLAEQESQREFGGLDLRNTREALSEARSERAALEARRDLYAQQEKAREGFPAGSRLILDPQNPLELPAGSILGALADLLEAPPELRPALHAALRAWQDTLLVRDAPTLRLLLERLAVRAPDQAATRLLAAEWAVSESLPSGFSGIGVPLLEMLDIAAGYRSAACRLLGQVWLVESLDVLPDPLPPGQTFVTRRGELLRADGLAERWGPESEGKNPLARRMAIRDLNAACDKLVKKMESLSLRIAEIETEQQTARNNIAETRKALDTARRELARKEGEHQGVVRDADRARQRLDTVNIELETCCREGESETVHKQELDAQLAETLAGRESLIESMAAQSDRQHEAETRFAESQHRLTEQRVRFSGLDQHTQRLRSELSETGSRIADLTQRIETRQESISRHAARIAELGAETAQIQKGEREIEPEIERLLAQTHSRRHERAAEEEKCTRAEKELSTLRNGLETLRETKNALDLDLAESRLRRQNRLERVCEAYGLNAAQLLTEPDPDWTGDPPPLDEIESRIAELNHRLLEMGPVNLVAIDEHRSLEERYAFLTAQQEDLVRSRDQVMDLIRRINKKSAEMFRETFEQANANFQHMFATLFDGGTARLELLDENLLESGIDIVARPPGKKLQNISLLSGGERTLTAVSLLFAIYLIKPSPFCMLDELDAALDDSNIGRFVNLLKKFIGQSQFVVITHNHHTITASDVVYGITMPESGVSRVMSMRLSDIDEAGRRERRRVGAAAASREADSGAMEADA